MERESVCGNGCSAAGFIYGEEMSLVRNRGGRGGLWDEGFSLKRGMRLHRWRLVHVAAHPEASGEMCRRAKKCRLAYMVISAMYTVLIYKRGRHTPKIAITQHPSLPHTHASI